ncbi:hypothetical protein C5Q97_01040 [Victivallales bacterium CCUG 44730]|nr:hypothetical protein C5Q97_01040 [Victivallales bacterium CCUG 44730]
MRVRMPQLFESLSDRRAEKIDRRREAPLPDRRGAVLPGALRGRDRRHKLRGLCRTLSDRCAPDGAVQGSPDDSSGGGGALHRLRLLSVHLPGVGGGGEGGYGARRRGADPRRRSAQGSGENGDGTAGNGRVSVLRMEREAGMIPVGDRSGMVKHYIRRIVRFWKVVWWFIVSSIRVHRDQKGRSGWDAVACSAWHAREWARGSARIFNFEIEVHGDPQQFPGGLIVSNHQGYLDILTHAAIFPIRFAPKMEMRKWPVLGPFVAQSRPIWINRTSRQKSKEAADEMIATLEHKINLLVYPEGTSTDGEHGLLPFKSTPFEAAVEAGCRIQPLLTFFSSGDPNAYPLAWFGHAALFPHIWRILGLSHVKADVYILPVVEPVPGENRKELAARVHELMCAEYKRIKGHDET